MVERERPACLLSNRVCKAYGNGVLALRCVAYAPKKSDPRRVARDALREAPLRLALCLRQLATVRRKATAT